MSDTPKTDKACGWPMGHHGHIESSDLVMDIAGPFVHSSVARELERENAALREQVEHLIGMIEQLEGDLAHFATIETLEGKKEAQP